MRVALTGATGLVGQYIARELQGQGHDLVLLLRPGARVAPLPRPALIVEGDLGATPPRTFLHGTDALVHAAFQHEPGRYRGGQGQDLTGFLRTNLMGSLALLEAARREGVGRAILLSSRAVYGQRSWAGRLDERHPAWPETHYGALKLALEGFARAFAREDGWPVTVLRPTGVYGIAEPFERTKWLGLVKAAIAGDVVPVGRASEVHAADVARAVALLLEQPTACVGGQCFNCSDRMVSTREIVAIVQSMTGARGPLPGEQVDDAFIEMDSGRLTALGLRFGGLPRLEATLKEICGRLGVLAA
ncbi:Nucleoside-diphosphate-sugar epimerase [Arboricoccus pini]|uniref:Nucleoside-diphosphate-sugar epimerase n=1 Tax=Arboricoccus pini TaxID=1963835 RepID=A0A212RUZ5_9PROT|nr:NAD(P)-dependent oxidoreductase [Arboricoccus pini]SNB76438.1 Nucleoside-diphosphate-sugar epimerase [Arboricoccus pini]